LIKDIVSESAASYVSILHTPEESITGSDKECQDESIGPPMAFSLPRFIPLLKERIYVLNPFTRTFLVGWITLLDSIPDLELVSYLPEFLGGLFKFLSDPNRDVQVATSVALERFLSEIKRISQIKKGIEESKKSKSDGKRKRSDSTGSESVNGAPDDVGDDDSVTINDDKDASSDDDWVPGQDVLVNHKEILAILTTNFDSQNGGSD
jgi:vacuole morphology and inheritance protein 14